MPAPRLSLLLPLAMGCAAPVSNAFLLEDLAYLEALPTDEQQSIVVDPAASPQEIGDLLVGVAQVNATTQDLLGWVEALSALPPTVRESSRRAWGPYPAESSRTDWRAEIVRVDQGRFSWAFDLRTDGGAWDTFFTGESVAGFDPRQSAGWLAFDADVLAAHEGDPGWSGSLEITFDYINEYSIEGELHLDGTDSAYAYAEYADTQEGWFWYTSPLDVDTTTAALETYAVAGQWQLSGGGRSDMIVEGGDLGSTAGYRSLCWDSAGAIVYQREAIDGYAFVEEGSAQDCTYTEPVPFP